MIKHEIRWEYILVICIILGTLPCNAQSVIPMPKEMVMGDTSLLFRRSIYQDIQCLF